MKASEGLSQKHTRKGVGHGGREKSFEFNLRGQADLFVCVAHRSDENGGDVGGGWRLAWTINPFLIYFALIYIPSKPEASWDRSRRQLIKLLRDRWGSSRRRRRGGRGLRTDVLKIRWSLLCFWAWKGRTEKKMATRANNQEEGKVHEWTNADFQNLWGMRNEVEVVRVVCRDVTQSSSSSNVTQDERHSILLIINSRLESRHPSDRIPPVRHFRFQVSCPREAAKPKWAHGKVGIIFHDFWDHFVLMVNSDHLIFGINSNVMCGETDRGPKSTHKFQFFLVSPFLRVFSGAAVANPFLLS